MTSLLARALTLLAGCLLMAAPEWYGVGSLDQLAWIAGPLLCAIAIVSASAVTRSVRWSALPVGVVLVLAAAVVHPSAAGSTTLAGCGIAACLLAPVGHVSMRRFGGGWRAAGPRT
jgi:O-antigen ligase